MFSSPQRRASLVKSHPPSLLDARSCTSARCTVPGCDVRVQPEAFGVFRPDMKDVFVGREAAQRLEPSSVVVSIQEELEVGPEVFVAVVVVALDGRILEGAVHPLDLTVGPWV